VIKERRKNEEEEKREKRREKKREERRERKERKKEEKKKGEVKYCSVVICTSFLFRFEFFSFIHISYFFPLTSPFVPFHFTHTLLNIGVFSRNFFIF
jgi:hypothetical protein